MSVMGHHQSGEDQWHRNSQKLLYVCMSSYATVCTLSLHMLIHINQIVTYHAFISCTCMHTYLIADPIHCKTLTFYKVDPIF